MFSRPRANFRGRIYSLSPLSVKRTREELVHKIFLGAQITMHSICNGVCWEEFGCRASAKVYASTILFMFCRYAPSRARFVIAALFEAPSLSILELDFFVKMQARLSHEGLARLVPSGFCLHAQAEVTALASFGTSPFGAALNTLLEMKRSHSLATAWSSHLCLSSLLHCTSYIF